MYEKTGRQATEISLNRFQESNGVWSAMKHHVRSSLEGVLGSSGRNEGGIENENVKRRGARDREGSEGEEDEEEEEEENNNSVPAEWKNQQPTVCEFDENDSQSNMNTETEELN